MLIDQLLSLKLEIIEFLNSVCFKKKQKLKGDRGHIYIAKVFNSNEQKLKFIFFSFIPSLKQIIILIDNSFIVLQDLYCCQIMLLKEKVT